ncbi:hypothetical protein NDU88_005708 [Pleurodeles waltl]|uniref:Uncharacterized protein n=1 Tax=Pleurodeles waltl TaxID=8319 RepID=A0AAV7MAV1_PLEWA|nr:hypothetical protein NDU88_005708 [Pleurodeles waltl]
MRWRTPARKDDGLRTADEEENAEDAGVWERDDGQQKRPPVQNQDTREGEDASGALTAAQEAHSEDYNHASGEAWHHQKETEEPMEIGIMKGRVLWSGNKKCKYTITVYLNGIVRKALVDSGCSQSVVRQDLVTPEQWTPQTQVLITCVHGDQRQYPVAIVHLNWRGIEKTITVGMIPHLGEDLILGTDNKNFTPLLEKACQENMANAWWDEAPFGTTEIDVRPMRKKLSRKEKREQQQEYRDRLPPEIPEFVPQTGTVLTIAGTFRQAQREDPTLKNAWQQVFTPGRAIGSSYLHHRK